MYLMFYIPIVTKRVWAIITNMLSLVWLKISIILYLLYIKYIAKLKYCMAEARAKNALTIAEPFMH